MIGCPASDADRFVPWVEDFFHGFGGDADGVEPMVAALNGIREYWVRRTCRAPRRTRTSPGRPRVEPHACDVRLTDRLTDDEMLDMLTVLVLAGLDTTRAQLGYLFKYLAEHPETRRRLIDEPDADSVGGRGVTSTVHDHLRRRTQGRSRQRFPRLSVEAWRHGVRPRVGGEPRSEGVRPTRRVRDRSQAERPLRVRGWAAPLPRCAPRPPRDSDRRRGMAARDPRLQRCRTTTRSWSAAAVR